MARELTHKQQRWLSEYPIDWNATQAAIRAGYSKRSAKQQGTALRRNPNILELLQPILDEQKALSLARLEQAKVSSGEVVEEFRALYRSDITHYQITGNGDLELREGAPANAMRAVSYMRKKITLDKDGKVCAIDTHFKLWDKPATLQMTARHLGMFDDRARVLVDVGDVEIKFTLDEGTGDEAA